MKALVTGAAGFIGSTLSARLLADGWDVTGIDALTPYYDPALKRANLERLGGAFTFVQEDLRTADLDALLDGVDVVFHEAGQPGVRASWGDEFGIYLDANVAATQALLEAAKRAPGLQRLVYASSSSVYGDAARFPVLEVDLPQPVSPYGVTKLAAEHLCSLYASNFGVPTVSLRYFTVFGPRQRPDMAFTRFLTAVRDDRPITLYGTGEQIRDFTYVDDVVEANVAGGHRDGRAGHGAQRRRRHQRHRQRGPPGDPLRDRPSGQGRAAPDGRRRRVAYRRRRVAGTRPARLEAQGERRGGPRPPVGVHRGRWWLTSPA